MAPKLKRATLEHGSARDEFIATLAHHPSLESLSLGRWGGSTMTDAAFESLATIKNLQKLDVYICALTWQGGLHYLKELPKPLGTRADRGRPAAGRSRDDQGGTPQGESHAHRDDSGSQGEARALGRRAPRRRALREWMRCARRL